MTIETPTSSNKFQKVAIALVAVALAVALFWGQRLQQGSASLGSQAAAATPIEVALANNKPTLLEFYADWCTSCQAMAPSLAKLKQDYDQKVNFAMLNVDNTKWLPEIEKYRVDGIPHFVFFDKSGALLGQAIGEQPDTVVRSALDEIIAGRVQPIANGQTSKVSADSATPKASDPRSHGAQTQAS
jgi:thiol-disulfide isomerase/thioredoxin